MPVVEHLIQQAASELALLNRAGNSLAVVLIV
jgi:hypothetical protein